MPISKSILIFHLGQLGDTLIALPAFRAIRRHFPEAKLTLLSDRHVGTSYVLSEGLLKGEGIFDAFESYPVYQSGSGRWLRPARMLALALKLRAEKYDAVVYLMRSDRTQSQVQRDRRFFALAGINRCLGMEGFEKAPKRSIPLPTLTHETDALLRRLSLSEIAVPSPGEAEMNLALGEPEEGEVERWLENLPTDAKRVWIGVGPGSKMAAKRWPIQRFERVVKSLFDQCDLWPVVFGGSEDRESGERMLKVWGRGYNAAGTLSLRGSAQALGRCALYLGNDTGTMHLAAAVGVPCVAIFSARDWPGRWYPYGTGHKVFRACVDCEGCGLYECVERHGECLSQIRSGEVAAACMDVLQRRLPMQKVA